MMELRINPLVVVDLKVIKYFIAEDNKGKALETVQEIYQQFEVWNDYVVLYKVGKEVAEIYWGLIDIRILRKYFRNNLSEK